MIWLSTTGDVLNAAQQTAFEDYIQAGGGYTGIHAAADTEYEWKWYGHLVGAYFLQPPARDARPPTSVIVEDTDDHSTQGLPAPRWDRTDEWYNYKPVNFEQTGDVRLQPAGQTSTSSSRSTSRPTARRTATTTDDDHPISWCQRYDGGRSWYTGMGHTAESFAEADYLKHILGGIEVSAGAARPRSAVRPTRAPRSSRLRRPDVRPRAARGAVLARRRPTPTASRCTLQVGVRRRQQRAAAEPAAPYTTPGTYTAMLTVTRPEGKTGTETVQITSTRRAPGSRGRDAAADPAAGNAAARRSGSRPRRSIPTARDQLVYRWDFGDGGEPFGRRRPSTRT